MFCGVRLRRSAATFERVIGQGILSHEAERLPDSRLYFLEVGLGYLEQAMHSCRLNCKDGVIRFLRLGSRQTSGGCADCEITWASSGPKTQAVPVKARAFVCYPRDHRSLTH
jgi:hypothetical protein